MFGTNIVVKPIWDIDSPRRAALLGEELFVHSIWPTIQGEGPNAGMPAIFIRLTGCNLRCLFCDTEFETGSVLTVAEIIKKVRTAMETCSTDLIVLTGGEPLRQQIIPLLCHFDDLGWTTQIETAGSVWPPMAPVYEDEPGGPKRNVTLESLIHNGAVQLVCSPKTPRVHPRIIEHCTDFKYIIRKGDTSPDDGLPIRSTQMENKLAMLYRPDPENVLPTIWVQPCHEYMEASVDGKRAGDEARTLANYDECVRIAMAHGYRISLQTHRLLGVD